MSQYRGRYRNQRGASQRKIPLSARKNEQEDYDEWEDYDEEQPHDFQKNGYRLPHRRYENIYEESEKNYDSEECEDAPQRFDKPISSQKPSRDQNFPQRGFTNQRGRGGLGKWVSLTKNNTAEDEKEDESSSDDRENYEEFEIITKKFIVPINEDTKYVLESFQKPPIQIGRILYLRADWNMEKIQNGPEFLEDESWSQYTYGMKSKFCCHHCTNKEIKKNKELFEKNTAFLDGRPIIDGWTTGNCTVQFLVQQVKSQKKEQPGQKNIDLKVIVRAFSQYCKRCKKVGDIGTYEDEIDRISEKFSFTIARRFKFNIQNFETQKYQRASNMQKPHYEELCAACKIGACVYLEKKNKAKQNYEQRTKYFDK